jgi:hypothetical protein
MIKALLLIFLPRPTWEHIAAIQRKWHSVFLTHLLPLLLLTTAAECYGLAHWGTSRGQVGHLTKFSIPEVTVYGIGRILTSVMVVLIVAKMVKALGETFHGRHSIHQVFTVAAYTLSPLFLLRVFNMFPVVSPWVTWTLGIVLSMAVLYHGLPLIMKPDPPHAFGLYFMSALLLTIVSGLVCFVTTWYLRGKFVKLDELIAKMLDSAK